MVTHAPFLTLTTQKAWLTLTVSLECDSAAHVSIELTSGEVNHNNLMWSKVPPENRIKRCKTLYLMALKKERTSVSWSIANYIILLKKSRNIKQKIMCTKSWSSLKAQENWLCMICRSGRALKLFWWDFLVSFLLLVEIYLQNYG